MPHRTEMRHRSVPDERRPSPQPAVGDGCLHPRTVVLGYDGSQASQRALMRAAEAAGSGGRVIVVTAVTPVDSLAQDHEIASLAGEPEELIEQASALLGRHDIAISTRIEETEPAEALVATASETGAALIVVGARGDNYPARALRGSIAEKLVARAPCDLLVAR
jgi:nucleotide-binding universal stress UspA family protein